MDALQITPDCAERLRQGDVAGCLDYIAHEGLAWWFEMDILRIALHLQALPQPLPSLSPATALRIAFLNAAISPELPEPVLNDMHRRVLEAGDHELTAAVAGAGCGAVWDSGYDFRRFAPWLARIDALLDADDISPLARASLLGFKANAQMNGAGDLSATTETCRQQILAAEAAHSASLRVFHAALQTYCHLWNGNLAGAGVLLRDAEYLCAGDDAALIPQVFLRGSQGLYHTIKGDVEAGRHILEAMVAQPWFEELPVSLWLLVQANLLFAIANGEDHEALEGVAARIQQRAVPQQNAFHHSLAHYCQGVAALGLGEPHRALAHVEQAIDRGLAAHSAVAERMPVLLRLQALADLGRDREARALAETWMATWMNNGFRSVASTAALEVARLALRNGDRQEAAAWHRRARDAMPAGEAPIMFHRPAFLIEALLSELSRAGEVAQAPARPIRIHCLGGLRIEVGDRVIHDRRWRSGRTKTLLKALVVHGGRKINMARLADLLWPDAEGDQANRNLKVLVWRLRRLGLEKGEEPLPWLLIRHGHLTLASEYCAVDVFDFESGLRHALHQSPPKWPELRWALDAYAGDFLPTDNSETWISEHRERLRRRFVEAALVLADIAPDAASREGSLACLQRALEIDELDERLYQRLMQLYLALGYPAKALEAYHAAQDALQRGLAITPGPVLVELARQAGGEHH